MTTKNPYNFIEKRQVKIKSIAYFLFRESYADPPNWFPQFEMALLFSLMSSHLMNCTQKYRDGKNAMHQKNVNLNYNFFRELYTQKRRFI